MTSPPTSTVMVKGSLSTNASTVPLHSDAFTRRSPPPSLRRVKNSSPSTTQEQLVGQACVFWGKMTMMTFDWVIDCNWGSYLDKQLTQLQLCNGHDNTHESFKRKCKWLSAEKSKTRGDQRINKYFGLSNGISSNPQNMLMVMEK